MSVDDTVSARHLAFLSLTVEDEGPLIGITKPFVRASQRDVVELEAFPVSTSYRRFQAVAETIGGITIGTGIGSFAVLGDSWMPILFLVGYLVFKAVIGLVKYPDLVRLRSWWIMPTVGLSSATLVRVVVPVSIAPYALGVAVAAWVLGFVVYALIDVRLDPSGRMGGRYV